MPLLPIMPPQMYIKFHSPLEALGAEVAVEWFLPCVDSKVGFHVTLGEEPLLAYFAGKRFHSVVDRLEVFGEAKAVDKALATHRAYVDPTIAVHPAMASETLDV